MRQLRNTDNLLSQRLLSSYSNFRLQHILLNKKLRILHLFFTDTRKWSTFASALL